VAGVPVLSDGDSRRRPVHSAAVRDPGKHVATNKTTSQKTITKKPGTKKPAAKKPAAKKPAAKKPAAKKPAAKKPAAKKPAAKKPAAKKPAAKKPAAKKPASKKKAERRPAVRPAPKKTTAVKKTAAKQAASTVATTKRTKKQASPFKVGDKVVYPHHGAATIIKRERIEFDGLKQEYYVLEIVTDQLTVRVPASSALERGVRPVISKNKARQVFQTLKATPQEAGANWSRWYKLLTEKINSGDIFQVAEVVRDLDYAQKIKGISPALKRMLAKARLIITSELQFSLNVSEEEAVKRLDRVLPDVEVPADA